MATKYSLMFIENALFSWIVFFVSQDGYYYYSHFTDQETKTFKG